MSEWYLGGLIGFFFGVVYTLFVQHVRREKKAIAKRELEEKMELDRKWERNLGNYAEIEEVDLESDEK